MTVTSLQAGKIQTLRDPQASNPRDRVWTTATFKSAVPGPVRLTALGLNGDEQADPRFHGGADKAVLVYSHDHYAAWDASGIFGQPLPPGAFGENILVEGMSESDVSVGDVYSLGGAVVEVSQPRQPCRKQARRWKIHNLVALMVEACRCGWYLRVRQEGLVQAGDRFSLIERPYPEWTISRAHQVMHFGKADRETSLALARCPALSNDWKRVLLGRA